MTRKSCSTGPCGASGKTKASGCIRIKLPAGLGGFCDDKSEAGTVGRACPERRNRTGNEVAIGASDREGRKYKYLKQLRLPLSSLFVKHNLNPKQTSCPALTETLCRQPTWVTLCASVQQRPTWVAPAPAVETVLTGTGQVGFYPRFSAAQRAPHSPRKRDSRTSAVAFRPAKVGKERTISHCFHRSRWGFSSRAVTLPSLIRIEVGLMSVDLSEVRSAEFGRS